MTNRFSTAAGNALTGALNIARELGHAYIGTEHLLIGLLCEKEAAASKILTRRGIHPSKARSLLIAAAGIGKSTNVQPSDMTPATKNILEGAYAQALRCGENRIATEHLLYALLCQPDCMGARLIVSAGGSLSEIKSELSAYFDGDFSLVHGTKPQGKRLSLPFLEKYATNLTAAASEPAADPVIGREKECERVIQILCRRRKNNPCLIGEPGVGKTAVVEGLAARIAAGEVPDLLREKLIFALDLSSMIAGAKYRGEFEERMRGVLSEASSNPEVILFIDEIHTVVGAGAAEGAIDAANILKPALARGQIQLIGATTVQEYRHIEKDGALERRFQPVNVEEPSREEAQAILFGLRDRYEAHHRIRITDGAIRAAVELSARYLPDRKLPDKALDLLDEAASRIRVQSGSSSDELRALEAQSRDAAFEKESAIRNQDFEGAALLRDREADVNLRLENARRMFEEEQQRNLPAVTEQDIADVLTLWTGIPVKAAEDDERERLLGLEQALRERVIGQEEAISTLAKAIRRSRLGLVSPNRPSGSFILMGPTGVGKTELAKALTEALFGSQDSLIRLDMSEYMEKHSVSKLIGSPPGYIGYDEGGQLTERVRRHPYSVILFDEIEKAHRDIFNILLQILDEGALTDSTGRKVDFRNTILLLTSNVGAAGLGSDSRTPGFLDVRPDSPEKIQSAAGSALREIFPPEFLGRIDEILVFRKLEKDDLVQIARRMLAESVRRIGDAGYIPEIDPEVAVCLVDGLLSHGENRYGARMLRRAIRQEVEDPVASAILSQGIGKGDVIALTVSNGKIVIGSVSEAPVPAGM